MTIGAFGLTLVTADSPNMILLASCTIIGAGMGTQMLALLLAVQHGVDRSRLGIATSLNQFARSIGAAIGVAAMGAILSRGIAGVALPDDASSMSLSPELRLQFAVALHRVFIAGTVVSAAGLIASLFLPHLDLRPVPAMAGEQLIEAEMASLDSKSEPIVVE